MTYHKSADVVLFEPDFVMQLSTLFTESSPPLSYMTKESRDTWRALSGHIFHCPDAVCSVGMVSRGGILAVWIAEGARVNTLPLLNQFNRDNAVFPPEAIAQLQKELQTLCQIEAWNHAEVYGWDQIHFDQGLDEARQFDIQDRLFTRVADSYDEDNQPRDLFIFLFKLQKVLKTAAERGLAAVYVTGN